MSRRLLLGLAAAALGACVTPAAFRAGEKAEHAQDYDHAVQTIKDVRYERWHDYDPEDTVRFYALRLHEVGMLKSSPHKIIAQGTDWRFFKELRKELKA